jgi:hypothetical protein
VYRILLNHIPTAKPNTSNTITNNDVLSPLSYALATTPESSHAWTVFKLVQEEAMRFITGEDSSAIPTPSSFTFPPSPFTAEISKRILELWNALGPNEMFEWEELVRDIRNIYARLITLFGNGITFDGKDWEEQRHYHARSLYFKWTGYQAIHGIPMTNHGATIYAPANLTQMVSFSCYQRSASQSKHPGIATKCMVF